MSVTRREAVVTGAGAMLSLALPAAAQHQSPADEPTLEQVVDHFTGGAPIEDGGITLTLPEMAEDGYRVPVSIDAPGAAAVMLVAPGNPVLKVLEVGFGPMAPDRRIATRMRLGQTQEVFALARMPDGTIHRAVRPVSVLVGGCG